MKSAVRHLCSTLQQNTQRGRRSPTALLSLAVAGLTPLLASRVAHATSATWIGGTGTQAWATGTNWSTGAAPGATGIGLTADVATFSSPTVGTAITIDNTRGIGTLLFDGSAGLFTIGSAGVNSGPSLRWCSGGAITLSSTASSFTGTSIAETINAPLLLDAVLTGGTLGSGSDSFTNNSTDPSNVLNIAGGITCATTNGMESLTLNGANLGANTISGALTNGPSLGLSITKSGTGSWTLSGTNTNTGATTVTAGTLTLTGSLSGSNVVTSGTGVFSETNTGSIAGTNTTITQNNSATSVLAGTNTNTGLTTVSAGTLSLTGSLSGSNIVVNTTGVFSEASTGSITGTGTTFTQGGTGISVLGGANTYTGATAITAGAALNLQHNSALGTGAGTTTSGVTVSSGGALQLSGTISTTTAVPITLSGAGVTGNANGALENVSGSNTYSGLITLGLTATAVGSDVGTLNLTNTNTIYGTTTGFGLILTGAGNGSIAGVINGGINGTAGAGTLTKNGSGTWALSGANTFTGGTFVNSGTLQLNLSDVTTSSVLKTTGAVTLAGGTLRVQGTSSSTPLTQVIGTLTLTANTSSAITLSDPPGSVTGTSLTTSNSGAFLPSSGTRFLLNRANGGNLTLGTVTPAAFAAWAIVTDSTGTGFGSINNNHQLVRAPGTSALVNNSNASGTDFTTNPNTDAAANQYVSGTLTFLPGTGSPLAHATDSLFINADATGVLDLQGNQLTLANNTLGMSGGSNYTIIDGFAPNGQLGASNVSVAPLTISQVGTGTLTINVPIGGGTGSLTKVGDGTLVLATVTQTYSGTTTIAGGTLQLATGRTPQLASVLPNGTPLITSGSGVLDLNGFSQTFSALTNGGTITSSSGTPTLTVGGINSTGTSAGPITGSLALTKTGSGTLTLSALNSYTGTTTVSNGTLSFSFTPATGASSALGNSSANIILGSASTMGILNYTGPSATMTRNFTINGAGGGEITDSGAGSTLTVLPGAPIDLSNGPLTLGAGLNVGSSTTTNTLFTGTNALTTLNTLTLTTQGGTAVTTAVMPINVQSGTFAFVTSGSGVTNLLGTGPITITPTAGITTFQGSYSGSTIGNAITIAAATGTAKLSSNLGVATVNSNIAFANSTAGSVLSVLNNAASGTATLTLNGTISGTGSILINAFTPPITLSGALNETGSITNVSTNNTALVLISGTIGSGITTIIQGDGGAGHGANPFTIAAAVPVSATLNTFTSMLNAAGTFGFTGGFTGTGNLTFKANGTGPISVSGADVNNAGTVTNSGSAAGITTISANIGSNVLGVVENGTSELILSGANTYTGTTTVTSGILDLKSGSLATGNISIGAAGTLIGDSSLTKGTINFNITTGGAADSFTNSGGTLTLTNLILTITAWGAPAGTYTIESGTYSGQFASPTWNGQAFTLNGNTQDAEGDTLSYTSGSLIEVTAVPEPASLGLLGAAALGLLARRRTRSTGVSPVSS